MQLPKGALATLRCLDSGRHAHVPFRPLRFLARFLAPFSKRRISSAVEQRNHNPLVGGSNPSFATNSPLSAHKSSTQLSNPPVFDFPCPAGYNSPVGHNSLARRNTIGRDGHRFVGMLALTLLLLGLVQISTSFAARPLPPDGKFAVVSAFPYPSLVVKGGTLHLGPGAKIYSEQNLFIVPSAVQVPANVLLRLDDRGEVSTMWVLTPEEAARYKGKKQTYVVPGAKGGH